MAGKHFATLILMLSLCACSRAPSIEAVESGAKEKLQQQLNLEFSTDHLRVAKVKLVGVATPKYEGTASVVMTGGSFSVPISVVSDGKTTLVSVDDEKVRSEEVALTERRLSVLDGKYPDYIFAPDIFALAPPGLKTKRKDLEERLQVFSPITIDGNYYFGSGCKAHDCADNQAAWTIDKNTGKMMAIIKKTWPPVPGGIQDASTDFYIYGGPADKLPRPLAAWAVENGMTSMNVVSESPEYQAPPK